MHLDKRVAQFLLLFLPRILEVLFMLFGEVLTGPTFAGRPWQADMRAFGARWLREAVNDNPLFGGLSRSHGKAEVHTRCNT